ncbi:MAG TPA: hypothetical protein VE911_01350 [Candidatus Nitrosopolaris sp.]|nr:hypothetical protein [Candidatus Nitrosopolaris sp.]
MLLAVLLAQLAPGWWLVMHVTPHPGRSPIVARGPYLTREACEGAASEYKRRPNWVQSYECREVMAGVNDR